MFRVICCALLTGLSLGASPPVAAASVIDFIVATDGNVVPQPVIIDHGTILVKGAGGDKNLDILFERGAERLVLIDHQRRRFTPVTRERVDQLANRFEDIRPLLKGLAGQIAKLPPAQRAKWDALLGGFPIERYVAARAETEQTRLSKTRQIKTVAGIDCESIEMVRAGRTATEFCLANPSVLPLAAEDSATLEAMLTWLKKLALRAEDLLGLFGVDLAANALGDLPGLPIEIQQARGDRPLTMTLKRIAQTAPQDAVALAIPAGYELRRLNLW